MHLSELQRQHRARVQAIKPRNGQDPIAIRLTELGFVAGETVRVVARGPVGGDPLVVQIGFTRFALRRAEAARIQVEPLQEAI